MAVVALVVHPERPEAVDLSRRAAKWLRDRGHDVAEPDHEGYPLTGLGGLEDGLDLAVSLGGDGTMLRTVQLAGPAGVPVMGVNLGHLGYLTEVEPAALEEALERFLAGDHDIEERMTLEVAVERAGGPESSSSEGASADPDARTSLGTAGTRLALNEALVEKTAAGHTVRLAASVAGRPFISYLADGLLVATPTGSTAYNLSVRGPIVSPVLRAMVVTPVSAHMLFDRSLVLAPAEWLRLELLGTKVASLVVDGSPVSELAAGDAVVCRVGRHPARLVTFGPRDFYGILKAKFGLTDR
jgi:NAD+ kinase